MSDEYFWDVFTKSTVTFITFQVAGDTQLSVIALQTANKKEVVGRVSLLTTLLKTVSLHYLNIRIYVVNTFIKLTLTHHV